MKQTGDRKRKAAITATKATCGFLALVLFFILLVKFLPPVIAILAIFTCLIWLGIYGIEAS